MTVYALIHQLAAHDAGAEVLLEVGESLFPIDGPVQHVDGFIPGGVVATSSSGTGEKFRALEDVCHTFRAEVTSLQRACRNYRDEIDDLKRENRALEAERALLAELKEQWEALAFENIQEAAA